MRSLILFFLIGISYQLQAQTLFTYGKHSVTTDEFLSAFKKNKIASDTTKNALRDYLDLYINFRLKVQEAKDMHLDTLASLRAELQNFRHQVEKNYTYDKKELGFLLNQALRRSEKDIRVSAILIKPIAPIDTLHLFEIASKISGSLNKDKNKNLSGFEGQGVKVSNEDLGYVTVFTLPYSLENIVFSLQNNEYSKPEKFGSGYIIFKKVDERPAMGKIKVAQILISSSPESGRTEEQTKRLADSLYGMLIKGTDFSRIAKEFSNDRNTYFNGGEMPEFGVGKYSPEFEEHAFELKRDGDISKPFKTEFGYHILKRISVTHLPKVDDPDYIFEIRQKLTSDDRIDIARNKLIEIAKNKTGFREAHVSFDDVYKIADSSLLINKEITSGGVNGQSVLFSFNDGSKVLVSDFDQYLRNSGKVVSTQLHQSYNELWPQFIGYSVLNKYQQRLEQFDPEFARQITDFKEGNMLFELMQKKVWQAASNDSVGLINYYNQHKDQYKWQESADAIIFSCNNEESADECVRELHQSVPWRQIMEKNVATVQADSARFEISQLPVGNLGLGVGISKPVVNKFDNTVSFVKVLKVYPAGMQRNFDDAKGLVIEDYQKVLENNWIKELRKKYPVVLNQKNLNKLMKM